MNNLYEIIKMFSEESPDKTISEMRLNLLLFLTDWSYACEHNKTITGLKWKYSNIQKVYADDLREILSNTKGIITLSEKNTYGLKKISYRAKKTTISKQNDDIVKTVELVNKLTKTMLFDELFLLVMKTPPLNEDTIYSDLDLLKSSNKIKQKKPL